MRWGVKCLYLRGARICIELKLLSSVRLILFGEVFFWVEDSGGRGAKIPLKEEAWGSFRLDSRDGWFQEMTGSILNPMPIKTGSIYLWTRTSLIPTSRIP